VILQAPINAALAQVGLPSVSEAYIERIIHSWSWSCHALDTRKIGAGAEWAHPDLSYLIVRRKMATRDHVSLCTPHRVGHDC